MADPEKLLVVDDEPNLLSFLVDLLEMEGYEVEGAASGTEAIGRGGLISLFGWQFTPEASQRSHRYAYVDGLFVHWPLATARVAPL